MGAALGAAAYQLYANIRNDEPLQAGVLTTAAHAARDAAAWVVGAQIAGGTIRKLAAWAAAEQGARVIDPNKLHHIFGRGGHGLDDVVRAAGSREAAFGAMEKAAQGAFDTGKLTQVRPGVFEGAVNVGGVNVTVRGAPVEGSFRIGSAWR